MVMKPTETVINCRGAKVQRQCPRCGKSLPMSACPAYDHMDVRCAYSGEHKPGRSRFSLHDCAPADPTLCPVCEIHETGLRAQLAADLDATRRGL